MLPIGDFRHIFGKGALAWSRRASVADISRPAPSAEDVVLHMQAGDILDTFDHPYQRRYPGQRIHAIAIEDYVFLVPFVESDDEVFLKTIIPSRKATKKYRGVADE